MQKEPTITPSADKIQRYPEGELHGVLFKPRWPSRQVFLEPEVMAALQRANYRLPANLQLLVSRGFEASPSALGMARRAFRALGILVFLQCFPARRKEIPAIFGANGHDQDGTHVDVSLVLNGRRLRFLPLGVFTPLWLQNRRTRAHKSVLAAVGEALGQEGFVLHDNATERLQIHCDYRP